MTNYYLQKNTQLIFAEFAAPLSQMYKERAEFVQRMENKKLVEQFTLSRQQYLALMRSKNMDAQRTVDQMHLSFEEFKRALVVMTLEYLPKGGKQKAGESYVHMLNRKLNGNPSALRSMLQIMTRDANDTWDEEQICSHFLKTFDRAQGTETGPYVSEPQT